ncbi:MAG: DUF4013 domain-containing protein [Anaerolineae bacterium]
MAETFSIAPLKKLFQFPFEAAQWQGPFVVGSALYLANFLIPIVPGIFVAGYVLRVMRQTLAGQAPALPKWDDWGGLARDGLSVSVIGLVYFLPALIVWIVGMGLYFAGTFYMPFAAAGGADDAEAFASFMMLTFGSMAIAFLSVALGSLFSILGAISLPLATAHFAAQGRLKAAFRVRQWWRILKADRLGYFVAWVVVAGLLAVLYVAALLFYSTMILCFLIPFLVAPIGFYLALVGAAVFGETYRESTATLAEGVEVQEVAPTA